MFDKKCDQVLFRLLLVSCQKLFSDAGYSFFMTSTSSIAEYGRARCSFETSFLWHLHWPDHMFVGQFLSGQEVLT